MGTQHQVFVFIPPRPKISRLVTINVSVFTTRCSLCSYFYRNLGNHADVGVTIDQGQGQGQRYHQSLNQSGHLSHNLRMGGAN